MLEQCFYLWLKSFNVGRPLTDNLFLTGNVMEIKIMYTMELTLKGNSMADLRNKWDNINLHNLEEEEKNGNITYAELVCLTAISKENKKKEKDKLMLEFIK